MTEDVNRYRQEGFAAFDRNICRGHRLSAARAYFHPVRNRPNLGLRTLTMVNRSHLKAAFPAAAAIQKRVSSELARAPR